MALNEGLTRFICLFHHADRATAAVSALEGLGIARESVSTLGDSAYSTGMTGSQSLTDVGVPERDLAHLQDGLRHGGVVVSLEAPEGRSAEIERIFHKYSADKIDEADLGANPDANMAAAAPYAAEPTGSTLAGEAVIPVTEESLVVGKREVERGGVRVYRHTVEQPVTEQVNLHEEHVVVNRRPVDRAVTEADVRAGSQEIELVETAEVPVVQKVARVVEEVRVGKVESDRTEVVQDSVRHTEVEVEQVDPADARTGRPETTTRR